MPLDPHLLTLLACPDCQIRVTYRRVGTTEELVCEKCKRLFPVRDGIPEMMPSLTPVYDKE
jgi:uncharacterized protein YbaR (Trm112 family)